jgi:ring-1,2-phenylacetyl-CoA epoxidase subunit PaaE
MAKTDFYPLTVSNIRQETPDCVSVAFEVPSDHSSEFTFVPGQYLTFKYMHEGEELRRSYSICSAPYENELRVAIKKVEGGIFSTYANEQLTEGTVLEAMPPMGNFVNDISKAGRHTYVAFGAGSGITPIISIIKTVLKNEDESTFTLVYGNQSFSSIIFREEIEALKNKYLNRFQVIHILSRERLESELNYGRIDTEKCDALCKSLVSLEALDKAFICGPEQMIHAVKDYLMDHGLDKSKVKFELFTSATKIGYKTTASAEKVDESELCDITIKVDDRTVDFKLAHEGFTILDAALAKGADLPYACKGGVCCTCKAKLIEGEVEMDVNYALEDDEVENGYILTCQSHPKSKKVVVDFDVS